MISVDKASAEDDTIPHYISLSPAGTDGLACVRVRPEIPLSEVAMSLAGIAIFIDHMTRDQEIRGSKITNIDGRKVLIAIPDVEIPAEQRRVDLANSIQEFLNPDGWRV